MEQYVQLIHELKEFYGVYDAKRIAKERVLNSLYTILDEDNHSQEKKLDTVIEILKIMRL